MKWTIGRTKEKELLHYFMPVVSRNIELFPQDYEDYFANSEHGVVPVDESEGYRALCESKRWRGIFCESTQTHRAEYENGILEGTMPYFTILGGHDTVSRRKWWQFWKPKYVFKHTPIPRPVVDYLKRALLNGKDAEIIEKCYKEILSESNTK